jgi:pilus assembly protein CpaB
MLLLAGVAFLVAIGVTAFTYRVLSNRFRPVQDTVQIVVAALPVQVGAKLTEADVRQAAWPKAVPIEGSFSLVSEVIGRGVLVPMVPNEPILATKLAPEGSGAGLMSTIPDGMRAVSVKVNDVIGVAGFVLPGSRVDLILSGSPTQGGGNAEMAKVILENIQVLAAGQNVATDDNGRPQSVPVVTLLVTPQQSEVLALATADGRIQLALRNPLDLEHTNPAAVRREHLFTGFSAPPPPPTPVVKPRPAARPAAPRPVVAPPPPPEPPKPVPVAVVPKKTEVKVYSGNKQETLTFEAEGAPAQ